MLSFKLEGTDVLQKRLKKLEPAVVAGLIGGVNDGLHKVESDAKGLAPVRTGELRDSIDVKEATPSDLEGAVFVGADYGVYVEHGTSKMSAQPFLFPATEANKAYIKRTLKADGRVAIRKVT